MKTASNCSSGMQPQGSFKAVTGLKTVRLIVHGGIIIFLFVNLLPLIIAFSSSFRSPGNLTSPLSLFNEVTLTSYRSAFQRMHFLTAFLNSVILTAVSVGAVVVFASMAAYPIARIKNGLSRFLYIFFLAGLIVPGQMVTVPVVQMIKGLHIPINQFTPILMFVTCSIPFSSFLYTGFIKNSVPVEVEEAAHIDGAGLFRRYWQIVFPLLLPATIAVIITQSMWIWNDFFYNMIFISQSKQSPLPLAMLGFMGDRENPTQWNTLFAACFLCALPLILAFGALQKYFMGGLTVGSVKG